MTVSAAARARWLSTLLAITAAACEPSPRGLSKDQIEQTLKDRGPALKSCWNAKGPHGELKLHVAITTSATGQVETAVADSKDKAVNACLEKQIKGWTFAGAASSTKFSLPVNFKR